MRWLASMSPPCALPRSTTSTPTSQRSMPCSARLSGRASTESWSGRHGARSAAGRDCRAITALGDRAVFVRGNGDRWVVDVFDAPGSMREEDEHPGRPWVAWTAGAIDRHDRDLLASFGERAVLDVDGLGPTLFCHGSPRDDEELLTALTPERRWRPALEGVAEAVVVCGRTHAQFDRQLGPWRVVNAGSVGLSYEGRGGAYWLLLGPDVEQRRTDYDVDRAIAAMRAGGNLDTDQLLSESLIKPRDPREVCRA